MNSKSLDKARGIAETWHEGQTRKYGEIPYIVHPVAVATLLQEWGVVNAVVLAAAYCHDLLEDTDIGEDLLRSELGDEVLSIVKELSIPVHGVKQGYLDNLAENGSAEAILIKTADRICNTRDFLSEEKFNKADTYFHSGCAVYSKLSDASKKLGLKIVNNAVHAVEEVENELVRACKKDS